MADRAFLKWGCKLRGERFRRPSFNAALLMGGAAPLGGRQSIKTVLSTAATSVSLGLLIDVPKAGEDEFNMKTAKALGL